MPRSLSRAAVLCLALVLGLAPFCVLLALPAFDFGIFRQVETAAAGLHLVSALALLGLMLLSVADPARLRGAAGAPVLALGAIALLGLALMPFADDPLRSLNGTLEHGVGILWFAEAAVLAAAATVVRRESPRAFAGVACAAAASVLLCLALQALAPSSAPYDFKEYLALHAFLAAVPLLALPVRWARWGAAALVLAAVAFSANRAGLLALLVAGAIWFALRGLPAPRLRRALAAASVAGAVLALAGLWASRPAWEALATASVPDAAAASVASAAPLDRVAIQLRPYGTLWGRSVSAGLVVDALLERPIRLLTGRGFGSFETVAIERSRDVPGRRFVVASATGSLAYWDGDQKAKFHSHNFLLEAVLSAGLLGGLAWLALVGAVARGVSRRRLAAAALLLSTLVVAGSLWFLVNAALPLLAVALAGVAPGVRLPRGPAGKPGLREAGVTLGCALLMVGLMAMAAFTWAGARTERLERAFFPLPPTPTPACAGFQAMLMPDRQSNVNLYRIFVRSVEEKDRGAGTLGYLAPRVGTAANYSCLLRQYANSGDVEAMEASLQGRAKLDAALGRGNPILAKYLAPDFAFWDDDIDRFLERAPGRTDILLPYLSWAEGTRQPHRIVAAVDRFLPRLPEGDPVRAYALAAKAGAEGDMQASLRHAEDALRLGIANLVPIPADAVAKIRAKEASAQ